MLLKKLDLSWHLAMLERMSGLMITPIQGPLDAQVSLPGSKSITNRALLIAALADGESRLEGVLFADDTRHMMAALEAIGIGTTIDEANARVKVAGCGGGLPGSEIDLYCGNSGTTIRFCAALVSLGMGSYLLDGTGRMRERPIGPLVDMLRRLGVRIEYLQSDGYPPLTVHATGLTGGQVSVTSPPSSQMISALLMAAPYAQSDVFLSIQGALLSAPYVTMTLKVMESFGVSVLENVEEDHARYVVATPQRYRGRHYLVEPDASNASYFLAAAAILGGRVTVQGLGSDSIQGDVHFVDVLERMGCRAGRTPTDLTVTGPAEGTLRGIDIDLNDMPDMAQTLAVVALFAKGETRIRNVANLRLKETDRLTALASELGKLGADVELYEDGLTIQPPAALRPGSIDTYDDHRMAMSFALAGLARDGVVINDPGCVSKTFPHYFEHLELLRQT